MAIAHSAVRWTISGDCFGGTEIWSTGFWTGNDASDLPGTEVPQATVDAVAERWKTFFTDGSVGIADEYRTIQVKAAYWNTDLAGVNRSYGTPTYHNYSPIPVGGWSTSPTFPPQIALAVSMRSGYHSGTAAHGRMYLPGVSKTVAAATGGLDSASVLGILNPFVTFVNGVNSDTVPGLAGKMILVGQNLNPLAPAPHNSKNAYVTQVRVGNFYDTQRRRRNGIREVYQTAAVA